MNDYLIGILFGGSLITSLGAVSTYTVEKKTPSVKSVARDFIIGSVLFVIIMQLLPESSLSVIKYISALIPVGIASIPKSDELELNVGIPKF